MIAMSQRDLTSRQISIHLGHREIDLLDEWAEEDGLARSSIVRRLILEAELKRDKSLDTEAKAERRDALKRILDRASRMRKSREANGSAE